MNHDKSVIHALRLNQSTPVRALCIRLSGLSAAGEDDLILGANFSLMCTTVCLRGILVLCITEYLISQYHVLSLYCVRTFTIGLGVVLALVDFPFYRRQSSDICVYCLVVYSLVGVDWRKVYFGHIFLKITHLWGQRFIFSYLNQHSVIDSRLESVNTYIILRRVYFFFLWHG